MHPLDPLGTVPGRVQLVGYVDDLRGLRMGFVDFVSDVLGDESPDFAVNAGDDAQHLTADGL